VDMRRDDGGRSDKGSAKQGPMTGGLGGGWENSGGGKNCRFPRLAHSQKKNNLNAEKQGRPNKEKMPRKKETKTHTYVWEKRYIGSCIEENTNP